MILKFRATIPESKIFFREYEVKGDMTLFKFNSFILNDLGFAPDQMVIFEGYDKDGVLCSEYGLFDLGDGTMDKVTFDMVLARGEIELHYVFDLHTDRYVKLVFVEEGIYAAMRSYPYLVDGKGQNPDQFSARYEEYEELPKSPSKVTPSPDADFDDEDDEDDDEDGDGDDGEDIIFDEDELASE